MLAFVRVLGQLAMLDTRLGRTEDPARAKVGRLQEEADARSFQGVRESVGDLIGKSGSPAGSEPKKP